MTPHQRIVDAARRIRQPVYLVTALYVVVGFAVGMYGAVAGDRLAAFLGFLFVSGALCGALLFQTTARLALRISAMGDSLDLLRAALERIEARLHEAAEDADAEYTVYPAEAAEPATADTRIVDLADVGHSDPSVLVAATLDRGRFPRLVTTMDEEKAAILGDVRSGPEVAGEPLSPVAMTDDTDSPSRSWDAASPVDRNLLWQWKLARREEDLVTCRKLYSAIVDTADSKLAAGLAVQMDELSARAAQSLRGEFADRVHGGDYAGALEIGNKIRALFPRESLADDFERIRPLLLRKLGRPPGAGAAISEHRAQAP